MHICFWTGSLGSTHCWFSKKWLQSDCDSTLVAGSMLLTGLGFGSAVPLAAMGWEAWGSATSSSPDIFARSKVSLSPWAGRVEGEEGWLTSLWQARVSPSPWAEGWLSMWVTPPWQMERVALVLEFVCMTNVVVMSRYRKLSEVGECEWVEETIWAMYGVLYTFPLSKI